MARRATPATTRATNWLYLLDLLFAGSSNPALGSFRSPCAFRGHALAEEGLSTALTRFSAGRNSAALEQHLLRNFRKYAHGEVLLGESVWQWLALAQHRGLPTRLLDWIYSPFVALHFATANLARMHEDGAVWAINFVEANRLLPPRLRRMLDAEGSDTFTVEMLGAFPTLARLDRLARHPFVVFLEPPSIDPRIVNQLALFSLMSSASASLDDWLAAAPQPRLPDRHPGGAEVGGARQARPAQHQRTGAVPGPGWVEPLARALLLAAAAPAAPAEPEAEEDTAPSPGVSRPDHRPSAARMVPRVRRRAAGSRGEARLEDPLMGC